MDHQVVGAGLNMMNGSMCFGDIYYFIFHYGWRIYMIVIYCKVYKRLREIPSDNSGDSFDEEETQKITQNQVIMIQQISILSMLEEVQFL